MKKAVLYLHPEFTVGEISPFMYGGFLENIGRCIYGGIYDPEHPSADEDGFRSDVLDAVQGMNYTAMRFPGGNAVSCYRWEDSVGPKEQRPVRLNVAFHSLENHHFGLDEYMRWCRKINAAPMLTINLASRGIDDAKNLVEYCNFPQGTQWSDWRRVHGVEEPYNVPIWFLGNELSGRWQMPGREAADYGYIARECGKMIRAISPESEIAVCGPCGRFEIGAPEDWLYKVLCKAYNVTDYLSIHCYLRNRITAEAFSSELEETDEYLNNVIAGCDYAMARTWNNRKLKISVDEWGVWRGMGLELRNGANWAFDDPKIEDDYTASDAVLAGGLLITLLRHADRVKLSCISEAVNSIAPIRTGSNGKVWKQTTYYPFALTALHGHGTVLQDKLYSDDFISSDNRTLSAWYGVSICNREKNELIIIGLNRLMQEDLLLQADLSAFKVESVIEHQALFAEDPETVNSENAEKVYPVLCEHAVQKGQIWEFTLAPCSWNMIRFKLSE